MIGAYVLVDRHEEPLYVGASIDVARRVRQHRSKPWWAAVADVWTFPTANKPAALKTEQHLTHALSPTYGMYNRGFAECPCGCERVSA